MGKVGPEQKGEDNIVLLFLSTPFKVIKQITCVMSAKTKFLLLISTSLILNTLEFFFFSHLIDFL